MLAVAVAALFAALAVAAPGERDRGFGRKGIAGESLGPSYLVSRFVAVAEADDGGILVSHDGTAQRYSALGARDTSFPDQPFRSPPLRVTQNDGKVLVPGEKGGIKRLLADGSPDPSFHGGESEALPNLLIGAIAASDSGQIFVAGINVYATGTKGCFCQLGVAHINPDGTLDKAFGGDGLAGLFTDLKIGSPQVGTTLKGLAPQGDGGVVVVTTDSALKLTPSGKLDTGYGKDGEVVPKPETIAGFQALPGGVLELAGTTDPRSADDGGSDFFVAHYGSAGQPDPSWSVARPIRAASAATTKNRAGSRSPSCSPTATPTPASAPGASSPCDYSLGTSLAISGRGVVARLRPDGRVDRGFADHGFLRAFPKAVGVPSEVLPAKGRLVVTKAVGNAPHPARSVLGFRSDGRPDPTYRRLASAALMPGLVSGPGAALQSRQGDPRLDPGQRAERRRSEHLAEAHPPSLSRTMVPRADHTRSISRPRFSRHWLQRRGRCG